MTTIRERYYNLIYILINRINIELVNYNYIKKIPEFYIILYMLIYNIKYILQHFSNIIPNNFMIKDLENCVNILNKNNPHIAPLAIGGYNFGIRMTPFVKNLLNLNLSFKNHQGYDIQNINNFLKYHYIPELNMFLGKLKTKYKISNFDNEKNNIGLKEIEFFLSNQNKSRMPSIIKPIYFDKTVEGLQIGGGKKNKKIKNIKK